MNRTCRKVLVVGGKGFLGRAVCKQLERRGIDFLSIDLEDGCDFRNFSATLRLFEKETFDGVIHCAAFVGGIQFGLQHPGELFYHNIIMTAYLIEAARLTGVQRFINPISNCAYPAQLSYFREEDFWSGPLHESVLPYGFAKKAGWVQGWAYQKQYGFDSVHLILPNMYGPGDHFDEVRSHALGALVKKFIDAKKSGLPEVVVWGTGKPVREWLYVEDGAEALVRALFIEPYINPINIGIGKGISIAELAESIGKEIEYHGAIRFDASKTDGAPIKIMEVSRMQKVFGWSPATSLQEGIKKTVQYYQDNF